MEDVMEMKKLLDIAIDCVSDDEKSILGKTRDKEDEYLFERVHELSEKNIATSMMLAPIDMMRSGDRKDLRPWQGKESDEEIAFRFENAADAQDMYDFMLGTSMVEKGEIRLYVDENQASVHFASGVMVNKPEVIQAALIAYEDFISPFRENEDNYESLADHVDELLSEATKVSGAPKGRGKGNPFHDNFDGKFTRPELISRKGGGSFALGKTKLKFAKAKKNKKGDNVVQFASTKRPCGREARKDGKDVRCWDGKKGAGIRMARVMKKKIKKEEIEMWEAVEMADAINAMYERIGSDDFYRKNEIEEEMQFKNPKDRKKVLMAIYKKFKSMGDAIIRSGKHIVHLAAEGYKLVALEDLTDSELIEMARKYKIMTPKTEDEELSEMEKIFGKGQILIVDFLRRSNKKTAHINDISRSKDARGMHFAKLMKAAETLEKKGIVKIKKDDGMVLSLIEDFEKEEHDFSNSMKFSSLIGSIEEKYISGNSGYSIEQLYNILKRTVNKGTAKEITIMHDELKAKGADMHIVDLIIRTGKLPKSVKNIPSLSK